ncbi:MAG TPA: tetratricopeptide repeat protein [Gemmatimonadota bacterium]
MRRHPVRIVFACILGCLLVAGGVVGQERLMAVLEARLATNPRDPAALEDLGVEYLRRGDYTQAFIQLQKAIAVDAQRGTPFYYLGLVYFEKGLYFKEIEAYQKAILLLPNFVPAHLNLAHAYLSVGKVPEAIEQYRWVEARQPGNLPVLYNLGIVFADLNKPAEARRYLTEYLRLAPEGDPASRKAAEVLAEVGGPS